MKLIILLGQYLLTLLKFSYTYDFTQGLEGTSVEWRPGALLKSSRFTGLASGIAFDSIPAFRATRFLSTWATAFTSNGSVK